MLDALSTHCCLAKRLPPIMDRMLYIPEQVRSRKSYTRLMIISECLGKLTLASFAHVDINELESSFCRVASEVVLIGVPAAHVVWSLERPQQHIAKEPGCSKLHLQTFQASMLRQCPQHHTKVLCVEVLQPLLPGICQHPVLNGSNST